MLKIFRRKTKLPNIPKHDLEKLKARIGLLAADDPLWPMLGALVEANLRTELEAVAQPGITDEEAHRSRGRLGMCLDLSSQLEQVWKTSHEA